MKPRVPAALLACASLLVACSTAPPPPDPAGEALARAELAFSADAAMAGVKAAFIDAMDDKAKLFRPGPVDGKGYMQARPDPTFDLRWKPQLVAVARSGELGLSTGPWRLTTKADPEHPGFGQFFTVWNKKTDGRWLFLFDHGIDHPDDVGWTAALETLAPDAGRPIEPMMDAEARFDAMSSNVGVGRAYLDFASPWMRALREGEAPQIGQREKGQIGGSVFVDERIWKWTMVDAGTAQSGDLGWVLGRYRARDAKGAVVATGWYVRVWRSERGTWRVLGDVLAPAPEVTTTTGSGARTQEET